VTFTDDKTQMTYLHFLKQKSDTLAAYKDFKAECLTQHKVHIKVLHSDHGSEYTGKEFFYLKKNGMKQKLTVHDTPQDNGVAECLNRMILEKVSAMLHPSGQLTFLWGEAACHAVWLKDWTSTKAIDGMTPVEALTGDKPSLCGFREWGSKVWVQSKKKGKLGGRVDEGVWVGIDEKSKGFRVYWPKKYTVTVEWNVYFNEQEIQSDCLEGEDYEIVPFLLKVSPNKLRTIIQMKPLSVLALVSPLLKHWIPTIFLARSILENLVSRYKILLMGELYIPTTAMILHCLAAFKHPQN